MVTRTCTFSDKSPKVHVWVYSWIEIKIPLIVRRPQDTASASCLHKRCRKVWWCAALLTYEKDAYLTSCGSNLPEILWTTITQSTTLASPSNSYLGSCMHAEGFISTRHNIIDYLQTRCVCLIMAKDFWRSLFILNWYRTQIEDDWHVDWWAHKIKKQTA